jgi:hypothetical protein
MFAGVNKSLLTVTELVATGPVCTGGVGGFCGFCGLLLGGVGDVVSPPPPPQAAASARAASARNLEPNRMSVAPNRDSLTFPATIRSPTDAFPVARLGRAKLSLAVPTAPTGAAARLTASARAAHVLAVVLDHLGDVLRVLTGLRSHVSDCTAEAHVIANDVRARRILEHVFDIRLAHPEVPVDVASVVRFVTI